MPNHLKRIPFPFFEEAAAFDREFIAAVGSCVDERRARLIPRENVLMHHHGRNWQSHNSTSPDEVSSTKTYEHVMEFPRADIVQGKLDLIPKKIEELASQFDFSFTAGIYETVSEACDRSGNVVSASELSPAEAFRQVLEQIEFGVDRHGNPSLPAFHGGKLAIEALQKDLESKGQQFADELDQIKQAKIATAMEREAERKSKFISEGE